MDGCCSVMAGYSSKLQEALARLRPKLAPLASQLSCCVLPSRARHQPSQARHQAEQGDTSWCRLAYWEERTRVGRQVGVRTGAVEVFGRTGGSSSRSGQVDSVSLASLAQHNLSPSPATTRTREKIGQGVILSRDDAGVWAYNRSEVPVFVNSPTLDVPNSRTFSVLKIPPGYTLQIFSWEVSRLYARLRDPALQDGPFDPHAVRISFAKGWGEHYSRQFVDCCPCWLEILLLPPR